MTTNDLTGKQFGRWTVISFASGTGENGGKGTQWLCRCECGSVRSIAAADLIRGRSKSCGCLRNELSSGRLSNGQNTKNKKTHGFSNSRIYSIWLGMKKRCYYPRTNGYENYGGRGIAICDAWRSNFSVFLEWALKNGYSDNLSIDRINVDGPYAPSNCRWATRSEQERNKRKRPTVNASHERGCDYESARY